MAQTKTSTKTTKKDLEAQIEKQTSDIEILEGSHRALIAQTDEYWYALQGEQSRSSEQARIISFKDAQISELQEALLHAQDGLNLAESLNDSLELLLRGREAQQNFILRVVASIAAYGGENLQTVRSLAESVLSEAVEVPS